MTVSESCTPSGDLAGALYRRRRTSWFVAHVLTGTASEFQANGDSSPPRTSAAPFVKAMATHQGASLTRAAAGSVAMVLRKREVYSRFLLLKGWRISKDLAVLAV